MSKIEAVKAVVQIIEDAPALAKFTDEVFAAMKVSSKRLEVANPVQLGDTLGLVVHNSRGSFLRVDGHSAAFAANGEINLVSQDGARFLLKEKGVSAKLPDGTLIEQEGQLVSTKLPSGKVIVQEKVSAQQVRTTVDGKELGKDIPFSYGHQAIGEGASIHQGQKHAASLWLDDGTYVSNSIYRFEINRAARGGGWRGSEADITVAQRYFQGPNPPRLTLHDPKVDNMFLSAFAHGSRGQLYGRLNRQISANNFASLKDIVESTKFSHIPFRMPEMVAGMDSEMKQAVRRY